MNEAIKNFFTQYSAEKVLALLITLILWTFSISRTLETRDYTVRLNIATSPDYIIVSEPLENIQVRVQGSVFDFAGINEKELVVRIDIPSRKPGKFTRFLDAKMLPFGEKIKVEKILPAEIVVRTAKKTERTVNIDPWLDGQPPVGWKITGYEVSPEKVTVTGPEQEISEIDSVTTEKIVLGTLKGSVEKELDIVVPSTHISTVETKKAKVSIKLVRDIKTRNYDNVPIKLDSLETAVITPAVISVTIKAPRDVLDKLTTEGFSVFINDEPQKRQFKTGTIYLKDISKEAELINIKKDLTINVKKVADDKKEAVRN